MGLCTVLVIHRDGAVRETARRILEAAGYGVYTSDRRAVRVAGTPELALLEWRGRERAAELLGGVGDDAPRPYDHVPRLENVIVVASAAEFPDALSSLALGAADCVRWPFEESEFVARVAAALSRSTVRVSRETLEAGPILLDKAAHRVTICRQPLVLAPTEFRLLAFFLEHPNRVFTRAKLLQWAWTKELRETQQRTVDVHVRRLRRVLEPFECHEMIQTVRGFGYRFSPSATAYRTQ